MTFCGFCILEYFPQKHGIIAPAFLVWLFICSGDLYAKSDRYVMHEYTLPTLAYGYLIMVLIPSTWQSNLVAWMLGFLYYITKVVEKRGEIPTEFWITMLPTMNYYILASFVLNIKLKELYEYIMNNEILKSEMINILETFPDSVMIYPCDLDSSKEKPSFVNHEFSEKIVNIQHNLQETQNVDVIFEQKIKDSDTKVKTDLHTYLSQVHKRLTNLDSFEQNDIIISKSFEDDPEFDDQVYTIKCIEVEWGGRPCFMDIFINTTNVATLKRANTDMKFQNAILKSTSNDLKATLSSINRSNKILKELVKEVFIEISSHKCPDLGLKPITSAFSKEISSHLSSNMANTTLLSSLLGDINESLKDDSEESNLPPPHPLTFKLPFLLSKATSKLTSEIKIDLKIDQILETILINSDQVKITETIISYLEEITEAEFKGNIIICAKARRKGNENCIKIGILESGKRLREESKKVLLKVSGVIKGENDLESSNCGIEIYGSKGVFGEDLIQNGCVLKPCKKNILKGFTNTSLGQIIQNPQREENKESLPDFSDLDHDLTHENIGEERNLSGIGENIQTKLISDIHLR